MGEIKFQNGPLELTIEDHVPKITSVLHSTEAEIRHFGFLPKYCSECYQMTDRGVTYSPLAKSTLPFSMFRPMDDLYFGYDGWNGLIFLNLTRTDFDDEKTAYDFVFKGPAGDLFRSVSDVEAIKDMTDTISEPGIDHFYIAVTKKDGVYHVVIGRKRGAKDAERDIRAKNMKAFLLGLQEFMTEVRDRLFSPFLGMRARE